MRQVRHGYIKPQNTKCVYIYIYIYINFVCLLFSEMSNIYPTSIKTLWRRRNDVFLYFPNETSNDVSMEIRQDVSVVRLSDVLLGNVVTTSQMDVITTSVSTYPRRLKQISNETPNDVSVVR